MFRARHSIRATNLGQAVSDLNSVQTCKLLLTSSYLVAAEYLAKGYKLSDGILQRAIHLDGDFTLCSIVSLTTFHDSREGNLEALSPLLPVSRFIDWC